MDGLWVTPTILCDVNLVRSPPAFQPGTYSSSSSVIAKQLPPLAPVGIAAAAGVMVTWQNALKCQTGAASKGAVLLTQAGAGRKWYHHA